MNAMKENHNRRQFLQLAAGATAATLLNAFIHQSGLRAADVAAKTDWPATMAFPEKGELLLLTDRPPNLEMPLKYLSEDYTPNEYFYVRWHHAMLPTKVDTKTFRLIVSGNVESALSLSLDELRKNYEPVSVVAVNQCSGNSRSKFEPRMPGVQWGNGAIGNAKWTGVRLKDILEKAKIKSGSVEVTFKGLDEPTLQSKPGFNGTPAFIKSLKLEHINDGDVMIAYAMNDKPLPMLNGFPLRLVVPGWYATYWIKALNEINVIDKPYDGFWMAKAYRVPTTPDFQESPKELAKETVPINRMTVRSLFASPQNGDVLQNGVDHEVNGVAFDSGHGITKVELSLDSGKTWVETKLDKEIGKFSFRRWRYVWRTEIGEHQLMVRATNAKGEMQTTSQWNRSGYARNVIEKVVIQVAAR